MKNLSGIVVGVFLSLCPTPEQAQASERDENLPELQSRYAKEALAGVVPAGESFRIEEIQSLDEGEKFARIKMKDGKNYWLRIANDSRQESGDTLVTEKLAYLWKTPVVEQEGVSETDAEVEEFSEEWAMFASASGNGFPLDTGKLGMASKCQNFITKTGALGPWGAYVAASLSEKTHPALFKGTSDMQKVCPKFKSMNSADKERFLIWLVTAVANNESSCNEKVKVKGVRGATAAGLMQMHLGKENLYGCKKGINSLNPRDNLECSLTILNNDVRRTGKIFPTKDNYFDTLRIQRGPGKRTFKMVKAYAPCN